jgi:aldehyde dehydrogenase (NAD+)
MTHANLIAGSWSPPSDVVRNINPSDTRDVVGEYARGSANDVKSAVAAATQAVPAWARSTPQLRADMLEQVGSEILARRAELADLLAREEGKTLPDATGEVTRAGQIAAEAIRLSGQYLLSVRPGIEVEVSREPLGVVGIVTPWNFTIAIPAWKIAPALACGNCVVFKPAELVPGSAWALADMILRAGVPAGVFNLVMGRGSVVGDALVNDHGVDAISFTGSVATGKLVLQGAARRGAKVQLEMGGKNPLVVLADADLELAAKVALDGAYFGTGQRCTASSRLIIEAAIHDRFVSALSDALQRQVIDDARKSGTTIGPVVDSRQLEQNLEYIRIGRDEGARLVTGGQLLTRAAPGHYLSPALFTGGGPDLRINQEEIFGPRHSGSVRASARVRSSMRATFSATPRWAW